MGLEEGIWRKNHQPVKEAGAPPVTGTENVSPWMRGCNKAVTEVFCKMHEKGYIYKGSRIVNWCPCM